LAFRITYKTSVFRDLKKLGKKESERILDQIEQQLSLDPESFPELKGKFAGLRKMRLGDYRVIYAILEDEILILRIGHWKDVNKKNQ
jgi:addiction module RelE/StbE family toxin